VFLQFDAVVEANSCQFYSKTSTAGGVKSHKDYHVRPRLKGTQTGALSEREAEVFLTAYVTETVSGDLNTSSRKSSDN